MGMGSGWLPITSKEFDKKTTRNYGKGKLDI
jgi:hypothetical protein